MPRQLLALLICLCLAAPATAKDPYEMSASLGLDEVGINKVLCLRNGNTMLLHFQIGKPIQVFLFDSTHKRIASPQLHCKQLDLFMLTTSLFKGLYEVGGEAVIFFEQQNSGRHSLIMLRINGTTGKLIEERVVGRSKSLAKPSHFYVMQSTHSDDGYQILYSQEVPQFRQCNVHVSWYNARHELYKDVPLTFDRHKYDYMTVVGAESRKDGIFITLALSTMLVNGTRSNPVTTTIPIYNHYLQAFYIPTDSTKPLQRNIDLSENIIPYYTHFTHNRFAGTVNLMLLSYRDALYRFGLEMRPTGLLDNLFFAFDPENLDGNYNWVTHKLANEWLLRKTDTTSAFSGFPICMHTDERGISTVVSESYERNFTSETYARARVQETFLGNLCITQLNDEGKEIWGTVLPKSQYYMSYRHYYNPMDLGKRWQQQTMFNDQPRQVFERQFVSANVYHTGTSTYIIYNDANTNIKEGVRPDIDTVYTLAMSNACYYKLDRKREMTKKYLYGEPLNREYKNSFIEGADFDEQRSTYASLIRYKRGEYVALRMAWAQME